MQQAQELGHDTAETGHDTAKGGHDTASPHAGACGSACGRATWLAEVTIQSCIMAGGRPCGSRYSTRLGRCVVSRDKHDTAQGEPRYDAGGSRYGTLRDYTVRDKARNSEGLGACDGGQIFSQHP